MDSSMTESMQWSELQKRFISILVPYIEGLRKDAKLSRRTDILPILSPWKLSIFTSDIRHSRKKGYAIHHMMSTESVCKSIEDDPAMAFSDVVAARFGVAYITGDHEFIDRYTTAIKTSVKKNSVSGFRNEQDWNVLRNIIAELERLGAINLKERESRMECRDLIFDIARESPRLNILLKKKYIRSREGFEEACAKWFNENYFSGSKHTKITRQDGTEVNIRVPIDFTASKRWMKTYDEIGDISWTLISRLWR